MLFGQNDFQSDETPQSIALKRQLIQSMQPQYGKASTIGEGLGQLFHGISEGRDKRRLNTAESKGRESATSARDKLFAALSGETSAPVATSTSQPINNPSNAPTATIEPSPKISSKDDFISMLMPAALEESKRTGIDPRIIVAQAAQETGWGKSAPGHNFFGIKSHGQGGGQTFTTHEVVDGKRVKIKDSFRQYGSPADSVRGYSDFMLKNPRYETMRNAQGIDAQLAALGKSGYATDPNYANSVGRIARSIELPNQGNGQTQVAQAASGYNGPSMDVLSGVLRNPFSSTQDKQLAQTYLKQMQRANDPMRQLQMQKLQQEVDPNYMSAADRAKLAQGNRSLGLDERKFGLSREDTMADNALARERFDFDRSNSLQTGNTREYQMYADLEIKAGRQPVPYLDFITAQKRAGAASTNVNVGKGETEYDKALGKRMAEKTIGVIDAGQAAPQKIATLEAMQDAAGRVYTGIGGESVLKMRQAAAALGFDDGEGISDAEFVRSIGNKIALELRNPAGGAGMPGAMSDKDREFLVSSVPGLTKTPEGNAKLINYMIAIERRNMEVAQQAQQYMQSNGGRLDDGFYEGLARWASQTPLFGNEKPSSSPVKRMRYNPETGKLE